MKTIFGSLLLALLGGGALHGQPLELTPADPADNPRTPEKIALGEELFQSPLLSGSRTVSCATCHDPAQGFSDGRARSRGILRTEIARNSPTLWGIGLTPAFPARAAPKDARGPAPLDLVALDLEQRCVSPIENPLEMGSSVEDAVRTLRALPDMNGRFDEAFGRRGRGVTGDRLGKALAAYLRGVELPESPYKAFVEGDSRALEPEEMRGLAIFRGPGQCASCHSGPRLSDGRMHAVLPLDAPRARAQVKMERLLGEEFAARRAELEQEGRLRGTTPGSPLAPRPVRPRPGRSDPYGGQGGTTPTQRFTSVQTPSLWDVARTGPWFRDGSAQDLELAVREHLEELRTVARGPGAPAVIGMPNCGPRITPGQLFTQARGALPAAFRPRWEALAQQPRPAELGEREIADLMAFLHALSPRS